MKFKDLNKYSISFFVWFIISYFYNTQAAGHCERKIKERGTFLLCLNTKNKRKFSIHSSNLQKTWLNVEEDFEVPIYNGHTSLLSSIAFFFFHFFFKKDRWSPVVSFFFHVVYKE